LNSARPRRAAQPIEAPSAQQRARAQRGGEWRGEAARIERDAPAGHGKQRRHHEGGRAGRAQAHGQAHVQIGLRALRFRGGVEADAIQKHADHHKADGKGGFHGPTIDGTEHPLPTAAVLDLVIGDFVLRSTSHASHLRALQRAGDISGEDVRGFESRSECVRWNHPFSRSGLRTL
jgi:hypothetical protein